MNLNKLQPLFLFNMETQKIPTKTEDGTKSYAYYILTNGRLLRHCVVKGLRDDCFPNDTILEIKEDLLLVSHPTERWAFKFRTL